MGCGASAKAPPAPLDDDQKQKVCNIVCKEMCVITATHGIKQFDKIIVDPPECIRKFDDNAARLRAFGQYADEQMKDAAGKAGDVAQDAAKAVGGGMFGKMAAAAAGAVDKAAEMGAGAGGAAMKMGCDETASAMEKAVEAIRKPFTEVGRDITKAKEKEITKVFIDYINDFDFPGAYGLCRDGKGTAISDKFILAMVQPLAKLLLPIVQSEIDNHAVTKYWDQAIKITNEGIKKFEEFAAKLPGGAAGLAEKYGPKPIELDLRIHIVTKCIEQYAAMFGGKEEEVRGNPASQSRKPRLFGRVLQKPFEELNTDDLKDEHDPNVTYA